RPVTTGIIDMSTVLETIAASTSATRHAWGFIRRSRRRRMRTAPPPFWIHIYVKKQKLATSQPMLSLQLRWRGILAAPHVKSVQPQVAVEIGATPARKAFPHGVRHFGVDVRGHHALALALFAGDRLSPRIDHHRLAKEFEGATGAHSVGSDHPHLVFNGA